VSNHPKYLLYESKKQPVLARSKFVRRLFVHAAVAAGLLAGSLGFGVVGYMRFERLSWIDAFLNSAMLLGGMGPVNPPQTATGKLFAGIYALYAGLVFIVMAALLVGPVFHRVLHRFHWDDKV
jgi:hypothetical protein